MTEDQKSLAEERHRRFCEQMTKNWPESSPAASGHIVASGITWHDKDGAERWMTGDMLLQRIDDAMRKHKAAQREALEAVISVLGEKFAEERARLRGELEAATKALELRIDTELLSLKQRSARLDAEEAALRQAQDKQARVVGFKAAK